MDLWPVTTGPCALTCSGPISYFKRLVPYTPSQSCLPDCSQGAETTGHQLTWILFSNSSERFLVH